MFSINEKVVCLHTFEDQQDVLEYGVRHPVKGEMYTIRTIQEAGGRIYLRFYEIMNPILNYSQGSDECQYWAERFRKLDYDFVEEVMANIKEQVNTN